MYLKMSSANASASSILGWNENKDTRSAIKISEVRE